MHSSLTKYRVEGFTRADLERRPGPQLLRIIRQASCRAIAALPPSAATLMVLQCF